MTQREKELELLKKECERLGDELSTSKEDVASMKIKTDKANLDLTKLRVFARNLRDEKNQFEQLNKKLEVILKTKRNR